jgi:antitoxin CcdA
MAKYETVSARIPTDLKEKMDRFNVKASQVIREALEDEVRRKELEELRERAQRLKPLLDRVTTEEVVRSIREDREKR